MVIYQPPALHPAGRRPAHLSARPLFRQLPAKVPPTLVLQGTLDPKTPYAGAQAQVTALTKAKAGKVTLMTVKNAPHFILWTAPACFEQASQRFIAGKPVPDCQPDADANRLTAALQ